MSVNESKDAGQVEPQFKVRHKLLHCKHDTLILQAVGSGVGEGGGRSGLSDHPSPKVIYLFNN